MLLSHQTIFFLTIFLKQILCFCEESYVVICDDFADLKKNDTYSWLHVQIGSTDFQPLPPSQALPPGIFYDLPHVRSLTVINKIHSIAAPFVLFANSQMQIVNLYGNDMVEIDDHTFENLPNIREIYLMNNNIQHLGRAVFKNTSLDVVNVSKNRLRLISSAFLECRIKRIILNHNEIRTIKWGAFPTSLEQLELNHNRLETIDHYVFRNLINLQELFLEHNSLTTIPDIGYSKKVAYLHFAHNRIEEVHYSFDNHPKLGFLDLSSNLIKNFTVDVFTQGRQPPIVMLAFNRLTNIEFLHPEKRTDLVLYGNPWNCDCLFKIEKIVKKYDHQNTCEVNYFNKGDVPVCIENGKCENNTYIGKSDIDRFLTAARICESDIRNYCSFRL